MMVREMMALTAVVVVLSSSSSCTSRPDATLGDSLSRPRPSPAEAIAILQAGNRRYVQGERTFARLDKARIAQTHEAQEPFATVLSCSDSRVPVEHVFDAGIGDLFVVRVAGNVCSDHEIGSIEYGVEHLHTPLVVVLGHSHCGAVTAVVENADVRGKFPHLAEHILPSYQDAFALCPRCDRNELLEETVRCNVRRAMHDLIRLSSGMRAHIDCGTLDVVGAVYNLHSGSVEWLPESAERPRSP